MRGMGRPGYEPPGSNILSRHPSGQSFSDASDRTAHVEPSLQGGMASFLLGLELYLPAIRGIAGELYPKLAGLPFDIRQFYGMYVLS